ncbi:hypothetical protein Ga0080574_TMP3051 [Salipiger abyssi]|uniref:Uncharacterized protein n=1 Tax=Salipiger abyssi TaxID=1250539 RepID=A0A1P8UVH3_9RHOB|nr:hypothetical protein Ga0080574_TMP3051 [Salipiger abyssi]
MAAPQALADCSRGWELFPSPSYISCMWGAASVKRNICDRRNKLWMTDCRAQDGGCGYVGKSGD